MACLFLQTLHSLVALEASLLGRLLRYGRYGKFLTVNANHHRD